MKKLFILLLILLMLLLLCACVEVTKYNANDRTPQPTKLPSQLHAPNSSVPTLTASTPSPTRPVNCDQGHMFEEGSNNCVICGMDYYLATLEFVLNAEGTGYHVKRGTCLRETIIIPDTYNGLPVKCVKLSYSTSGQTDEVTTKVILPNTLSSIDQGCFRGLESLVSMNIPDGITTIGEQTFKKCESLVDIVIPETVTTIGEGAFSHCLQLRTITLPKGLTSLGVNAFNSCEALEEITIPDGVTEISIYLFAWCFSLKTVTYGENVTKIGRGAFKNCVSLESFTIGEKVTLIEQATFEGCASLAAIVIPDTVAEIHADAFKGCENLETVILGTGIRRLGNNVFQECDELNMVYYRGTREDWAQVELSEKSLNENITIYFYSETQPTQPGNYWRYVDGIPAPWEIEE